MCSNWTEKKKSWKKWLEIQIERQSKAKSNDMLFVSNWGSLEADPYVTVSPKYLNFRANGLSPRGWFWRQVLLLHSNHSSIISAFSLQNVMQYTFKLKTRPSMLCLTHQISCKKRNYLFGWWHINDISWYLMVLGQYKLVLLIGIRWYRVSKGLECLYILEKVEIWSGVTDASHLTDNRI